MKRLTRKNLLNTMVELAEKRSLKSSSLKFQDGYEAAFQDVAAEFRLNKKDGEAK